MILFFKINPLFILRPIKLMLRVSAWECGHLCPRSQDRHSREGVRVVLTLVRFRVCLLAEERACAF
jgi:hypothetical protein